MLSVIRMAGLGLAVAIGGGVAGPARAETLVPFRVVDDAIPDALTNQPGNVDRGRALVQDRSRGNCVTCHELPVPADFQGNYGPPLEGVGDRYTAGQLRLRIVDGKRLNPESNMPSYYRVDNFTGVGRRYVGHPILTAQEVEDVIAYLLTLK